MIIILLINLCLVFCGLVESTEEVDTSQQTLPSPQNVGSGSKESTLDINNVDSSIFTVDERLENDIRTLIYEVRDGYKVTSVVLGNTVWNAGGNDVLSSCILYIYGGYTLIILGINGDNGRREEYFEVYKKWVPLTLDGFRDRLQKLQGSERTAFVWDNTLDISGKRYPLRAVIHNEICGKVHITTFRATSHHPIYHIVDNGCSLWTVEEDGERCIEAWVHALNGSSICRLNILHADNVIWTKYLEKGTPGGRNGPSWTTIDRHAYMQRHKAMHTSKEIRVDMTHIDPFMCNYAEYVEYDTLYTFGHPFSGYKVSSVIFHGRIVWESTEGHCKRFKMIKVGHINIFEITVEEKKVPSTLTFALIEKNKAMNIKERTLMDLENMDRRFVNTRMNVTGPIDPLHFDVYGYKRGKTTTYVYIPRLNTRVNFIFKGHVKIWGVDYYRNRCLKVVYTPCHNGSSFLHADVIVGGVQRHLYLQAVGQNGSFTRIIRRDYIARLGLQNDSDRREDDAQDDPSTVHEGEELTDDTDILQTN